MNRGPSQEYLLQGSILDDSVEMLLHRLRGMSDDSPESLIKFKEHELVYSMRESTTSIVSVRVRRPLLAPDQTATLCYLGHPELGDKNRPTTVRTCVEVNCTPNVCAFLQELGFRVEFEYVTQGWRFRKNRLKATVAKIHKIMNPPNLDQIVPMSKSHLVEVSTVSNSGDERAANEVQMFSAQLQPLVHLEKKDPRRPEMQ
jgi:mediator of RNA polymerase II transcription subunit 18